MTKPKETSNKRQLGTIILSILLVIFVAVVIIATISSSVGRQADENNADGNTSSVGNEDESEKEDEEEDDFSTFTAIGSDVFEGILDSGQEALVLVGRPTCSACVAFAPRLKQAVLETGINIYYYNTDAARGEENSRLYDILDRIGVNSVPNFSKYKNGEIEKELGNYSSLDEIKIFLQENQ